MPRIFKKLALRLPLSSSVDAQGQPVRLVDRARGGLDWPVKWKPASDGPVAPRRGRVAAATTPEAAPRVDITGVRDEDLTATPRPLGDPKEWGDVFSDVVPAEEPQDLRRDRISQQIEVLAKARHELFSKPCPGYSASIDLGLGAHMGRHLPERLDAMLATTGDRLNTDVKVLAAAFEQAHRFLVSRGVDVSTDPAIDRYVATAVLNAVRLAANNPHFSEASAADICSKFRPNASATFRVLRDELDALPATRPIAPRNRWRLFIDPAVVDAVKACGIDTRDNPLMAFLFDAEEPGYCHTYASGLADALSSNEEPLDLQRLRRIAKACANQEAFYPQRVIVNGTFTDAGLELLADSIDYMVEPYQMSFKMSNSLGNSALFSPGASSAYASPLRNEEAVGRPTHELLRKLVTDDGGAAPYTLKIERVCASAGHLENYARNTMDDHRERVEQRVRTTRQEVSSGESSGSSSGEFKTDSEGASSGGQVEDPALPAGYLLYANVLRGHVYANGNTRIASTLLAAHLDQCGLQLTVLHDGSTADGYSVDEGCDEILKGQALVRTWYSNSDGNG